jgi:hypothetical protein
MKTKKHWSLNWHSECTDDGNHSVLLKEIWDSSLLQPTYLWDCRENSKTTLWRQHNNECSHNIMSVTHKCVRPSPLHEQQWQPAMTTHCLHQLRTVGADEFTNIQPKFWANHYTSICVLSFCCISGSNRKTQACWWLALKRQLITKVNSILIQVATSLWGQLKFILACPSTSKQQPPELHEKVQEYIKPELQAYHPLRQIGVE